MGWRRERTVKAQGGEWAFILERVMKTEAQKVKMERTVNEPAVNACDLNQAFVSQRAVKDGESSETQTGVKAHQTSSGLNLQNQLQRLVYLNS